MEAMTGSDGAALSGEAFWQTPGAAAPAAAQALHAQRTHPAIAWLGPVYDVMEQTSSSTTSLNRAELAHLCTRS